MLVEFEGGFLNAVGLPNSGVDASLGEIEFAIKNAGVPVFPSIFGGTKPMMPDEGTPMTTPIVPGAGAGGPAHPAATPKSRTPSTATRRSIPLSRAVGEDRGIRAA